ncbi:MAG: GAF domain-containing protein [Chloroflexi bacterium]|nr:GAF domain-containing protein [Chloroflexota bacterium]
MQHRSSPRGEQFGAAIAGVARAVAEHRQLAHLVLAIPDQVVAALLARSAYVCFADVTRRALRLAGHRNLPPDLVRRLERVSFDASLLPAWAAATQQVRVVEDVSALPPPDRAAALDDGARSALAIPLLAGGEMVGVLGYTYPQPHHFTPDELTAARTMADIVSVGIVGLQAREAQRRLHGQVEAISHASLTISDTLAIVAAADLQAALQRPQPTPPAREEPLPAFDVRAILQAIVDQARLIAGAEYAALGIVAGWPLSPGGRGVGGEGAADPSRKFQPWVFSGISQEQAAVIGPYPRPVGTLGLVAREGQPIRVPDVRQHAAFAGFPAHHPAMTSFLGVPISYHGRSMGNLYLANKVGAEEFSEEDQRAIEVLARHAALAVEHARVHDQLVRDIVERRRAEAEREHLLEQLDSERVWLRTVIDRSPVGIILLEGAGGERIVANRRAEELFGHPIPGTAGLAGYVGEIRHADGTTFSLEDLQSIHPLRRHFTGEELLLHRPDGQEVPILASAGPIQATAGDAIGAIIVFEDITPIKELERLREEWTSVVAHDLRTPIAVISGYAQLLERVSRRGGRSPEEQHAMSAIRASAEHLNRMVSDLLDASRIEARRLKIERQRVDLPALVREMVGRTAAIIDGHRVRVEVRGDIAPIWADPGRVEQVLSNLLTNAAKYSYPDTEIQVEVERRDGEAQVSVTNQGSGIPPEEIPHLFTRFYRTRGAQAGRTAGVGLGLYIARGLVEAHGGRIWATSSPGQTTTFAFTLPVAAPDGA